MPSLTSYVLVGVGYFQRAIDWFDQLAPSSRLEDLRRLVSDIRQNSRPLATAVQHVRSFLHLPTHDPIPTIEVLQHLLRPVLLLRTRLAETGVLLNIVSTIDRSQCPIDKDKQLIDDLVAARRGPTWWVWEWRRQELAAAAKNVVKQPPLPQGSKYTQVQTVFVALKEVRFHTFHPPPFVPDLSPSAGNVSSLRRNRLEPPPFSSARTFRMRRL